MCDPKQMDSSQPDWLLLDDLVMEKIFELLPVRDRFSASLVCRRWSVCFELPKVWRNVDVDSVWITKSLAIKSVTTEEIQINRSLDYDRVLTCLQRIGHHIRNIHIRASQDFSSLYQFFVLLETYFDAQKQTISCSRVRKLTFKFPCDEPLEEDPNGIKLFGIGGQLIGSFKKLLSKMENLTELKLTDLVLDRYEANSLMDRASICLNQSLKQFKAINFTLNHCPLRQIGMLFNLEVLKLSPQNIDDSMLQLITQSNLKHFHIIQNENTPETVTPCGAKAWLKFKRDASRDLKVHLGAISKRDIDCDLLIQPEAPVHSITCENIKKSVFKKISKNYSNCLSEFSNKGITLCDSDMIEIISKCNRLSTLEISRPITAPTLLILIAVGENLQKISVRKSNVIVKCEEWVSEFCCNNNLDGHWVHENCVSLEKIESAISSHFSRCWHFLN